MSSPSPGELEEYRAYLYRYALLHVRDVNRAEDAVMETDDICREMGITSTNCWVILYRARMSLRQCLEICWFGNGEGTETND